MAIYGHTDLTVKWLAAPCYGMDTREPTSIVSGDTVTFQKDLADYPASTWTLKYTVAGASVNTYTAAASGDSHLVTIAASATATFAAGDYLLTGYVEKDSERHTVYSGSLTVKADPTGISAGYDPRTHAKKTLDAIEAVIAGRAGSDVSAYTIGGRSLTKIPIPELVQLRQVYKGEVAREKRAARIAAGQGGGGQVRVRF